MLDDRLWKLSETQFLPLKKGDSDMKINRNIPREMLSIAL